MTITAREESGNVFAVCISGQLKKSEWDAGQAAARTKWENYDAVKILLILDDFKGWEGFWMTSIAYK